jgi:hypothetical protein
VIINRPQAYRKRRDNEGKSTPPEDSLTPNTYAQSPKEKQERELHTPKPKVLDKICCQIGLRVIVYLMAKVRRIFGNYAGPKINDEV